MAFAKKLLTTSLLVGGTLGALAIYNKTTETLAGELDTVLTGEERRYPWKYGDMFYAVKGPSKAKSLVLIHGFSPGTSSYEWRKNMDNLAEQFRVYAIDLLGFGMSDHPTIDYTPETYTDLIHDFIRETVGQPAIVVAHGLSCAYVIACAYRRPELFERLILVSPSPTILQESYPGPINAVVRAILRSPILGQFIYNLLTSRQTIRNYYDQQGYHNPGLITDEMVEYVYTSAHQPNSRYPIADFLSNYLTFDVHEPFARLKMPIIAVWGREGMLTPSEASTAFQHANPRIETRIIDRSRGDLQIEQASQFNDLVREFANIAVK